MKQVLGGLFLFILGVAVGVTGSDDSLLKESRQREAAAFGRGHAAAREEMQAMAVQTGAAKWVMNPHTGQADRFVWKNQDQQNADTPENVANGLRIFTDPLWDPTRPDGV